MREVTLGTLQVGTPFTFPKGTEGAGLRYTVLENNGDRCAIQSSEPMTPESRFYPIQTVAGGCKVVAL